MSMSQILVLTHDQRTMLKIFLPAFKIARLGSVEEQQDFWESVYSQWFAAWPEHAMHFGEIPHDQMLSGLQEALLIEAIRRCHQGKRLQSIILMNTLYQEARVTLKEYFPVKKSRRTAQKKLRITVLESCLPWLFASPRLTAIPVKMAGKKWATPEQEEFLLSFMSEFRESAATKNSNNFFTRIGALWFKRWPEEHVIFKDKPDDYVRTTEDIKAVAGAVETHQQINPAYHACSKGARGMLKFDTVLGGGVELKGTRAPQKIDIYSHKFYEAKVKHAADNAITIENITNRGPKLNKHHEITRQMYLEESESVKADINRKYHKVKSSFAKQRQQLKSGKPLKLDDATKVKAIQELGPMLDCILKYLAHIKGWVRRIGELQSGAQFNHVYKDFDRMQAAFLGFVQNALDTPDLPSRQSAFESTLPHDETAGDEDEESSSDWDSNEDNTKEQEKEGTSQDEHLPTFDTSNLYWMTPRSDGDNASSSHTLLDTLLPKALPTNASKVSTDASMEPAGSSSLAVEFLCPHSVTAFDPIGAGTTNFSAFDPHAFATIINNPNFEMIPDWFAPPLNTTDESSDSPASGRSPTNLTSLDNCDRPYLPSSEEVLLPPVPSVNSKEGQDNDSLLNQPEISGTYTIYGPIYIRPSGSAHGDEHTSSPYSWKYVYFVAKVEQSH
ncbi:hypothetical protein BDR03DRAFT_986800 [Suillus americanus]|nr:hypothetical protein BDR03DRAFT_986800 [Suillus americanus]